MDLAAVNNIAVEFKPISGVLDLSTAMRDLRNRTLNETVDRVNPVWYASLTADQQAELATYRTALLNIPQQSGWPATIEWPTKPTWL
jgi:hypothetical protein